MRETKKRLAIRCLVNERRADKELWNSGIRDISEILPDLDLDDHLSPWSLSADRVDSPILLVGQDWASIDSIRAWSSDQYSVIRRLGRNPKLETNIRLDFLIEESFGLKFSDCYATNAFVFIKPGNASSRIATRAFSHSVLKYLLPLIGILRPKLVLCLGVQTFSGIARGILGTGAAQIDWRQSISDPLVAKKSKFIGLPHPGYWGTRNAGGEEVVLNLWKASAIHL